MAAAPPGLLTVNAQAAVSMAAGAGQYAVVSKHATWGIFETMAHAHREAELIRHSGAIPTTAVRCTPEMVKQYQLGKLGNFVEIDGWAVTPKEAKLKGLDMLRRAGDREHARRQFFDHHVATARTWVERFDEAREDGFWYSSAPHGSALSTYEKTEDAEEGTQLSRCSQRLFEAIKHHQSNGGNAPEMSALTSFHMLAEEHEERLSSDIIYRLAFSAVSKRREPASIFGPTPALYVVVMTESHWIFGAGETPENALEMAAPLRRYIDDELEVVPASQALARAVLKNGYEVPGFWAFSDGAAVHEVELNSL
ncbi:MAG: hypothetical protein ACR2OR_11790 [Hyphomicrobiales bacterium]